MSDGDGIVRVVTKQVWLLAPPPSPAATLGSEGSIAVAVDFDGDDLSIGGRVILVITPWISCCGVGQESSGKFAPFVLGQRGGVGGEYLQTDVVCSCVVVLLNASAD